jgi:hypothetical protein
MYGELTMIVTVNFDGRCSPPKWCPSGNLTLDAEPDHRAQHGAVGMFTDAVGANPSSIIIINSYGMLSSPAANSCKTMNLLQSLAVTNKSECQT